MIRQPRAVAPQRLGRVGRRDDEEVVVGIPVRPHGERPDGDEAQHLWSRLETRRELLGVGLVRRSVHRRALSRRRAAPDQRRQDARACLDLVERDALVGAVREPDVTRPEHDAWRLADVDEQAHVGAVGHAHERRLAAGDLLARRPRARSRARGRTGRARSRTSRRELDRGRMVRGGTRRSAQQRSPARTRGPRTPPRASARAARRSGPLRRRVHDRGTPIPAWTVPTIVGYGSPSAVMSGSVSSPLRKPRPPRAPAP